MVLPVTMHHILNLANWWVKPLLDPTAYCRACDPEYAYAAILYYTILSVLTLD